MHTLSETQLNLRVPQWLKDAIERAAKERRESGANVTATGIAREILWERFKEAKPDQAKSAA